MEGQSTGKYQFDSLLRHKFSQWFQEYSVKKTN